MLTKLTAIIISIYVKSNRCAVSLLLNTVMDVCQLYFNKTAGKEEVSTSQHFLLKSPPWARPPACPECVSNRNQGHDVFLCSSEVLTQACKG